MQQQKTVEHLKVLHVSSRLTIRTYRKGNTSTTLKIRSYNPADTPLRPIYHTYCYPNIFPFMIREQQCLEYVPQKEAQIKARWMLLLPDFFF